MSGFANTYPKPRGIPGWHAVDEIERTNCLSASARKSLYLLAQQKPCPPPVEIQELMISHDWTVMRAWRHWRGYSKTEDARRVGVQVSTYELIEDGTVELGPFLQPTVESVLLE